MYAIIRAGGKQFKAEKGKTLRLPLMEAEAGSKVTFDEVLLSSDGQTIKTGAPLVQDRTQWDARWDKGLPALVSSTLAGLNGMPPGGQCFSCTAKDYEALISFMAGRE